MKKTIPYFLFIFSICFVTFVWDLINIPFNPDNAHGGDSYGNNQYHSQNDTLRFIIYVTLPLLILIFYYQIYEKKFLSNVKNIIFKYDSLISSNETKFKLFFWITFGIIFLEFFFIDFTKLDYHIDIFHEGLWLTASENAKIKSEFWKSSYIGRGFFGNFYPNLLWKFFNIESIGITRFFNLCILLLNKILLLLIAHRIALSSSLKINEKIIFFLLLSLTLLIFTSYIAPVFFLRSFLLLLFMFLLLNFIILENKKFVNLIFIGLLSSLGMLWYIDIGIYINFILFLLFIFFIIKKEILFFFVLVASTIFGWIIIYFNFPKDEFIQFIDNTKLIILTIDYIHGLIFPTPFLSQDTRSTKAVILFLITGFLIIKSISATRQKDLKFLLIMTIFFTVSILYFKYGLSRSDGGHIKIASGFIYIPLFSLLYYKFIYFVFNQKKIFYINSKKIISILLIIFLSTIFFNKKFENKSFSNLIYSKKNIQILINYPDKKFINESYQNFISFYEKLSYQDKCVMIFTNEVAIPYFLKKPTCSKYYLMYTATPSIIQKDIIQDLEKNSPLFLVYKSDIDTYGHAGNKLKLLDTYINEKYIFFKKFKYWEIYKKRKK